MSTVVSICAACGKEGDGLKKCTSCKEVRYCNAICQRAHWKLHKKRCKQRAAALHQESLSRDDIVQRAARGDGTDEALFQSPPPREDCPICCLPFPALSASGLAYQPCCGQQLCTGCIETHADANLDRIREKYHIVPGGHIPDHLLKVSNCPFCNTPCPDGVDEASCEREYAKRIEKRAALNDVVAIHQLGLLHISGQSGFSRNTAKGAQLMHRAAELGSSNAHLDLATNHMTGQGAKKDRKKSLYHMRMAAMGGNVGARHNLGAFSAQEGRMDVACRHWMISASGGEDDSLKHIKHCYMNRQGASKGDYLKALLSHRDAQAAEKSEQRGKFASATSKGMDLCEIEGRLGSGTSSEYMARSHNDHVRAVRSKDGSP